MRSALLEAGEGPYRCPATQIRTMWPSRCYLPWLMTTLTANAARDLLAVVPDSTGTIGAAAETIETVTRGALAAGRGVELAYGCFR